MKDWPLVPEYLPEDTPAQAVGSIRAPEGRYGFVLSHVPSHPSDADLSPATPIKGEGPLGSASLFAGNVIRAVA